MIPLRAGKTAVRYTSERTAEAARILLGNGDLSPNRRSGCTRPDNRGRVARCPVQIDTIRSHVCVTSRKHVGAVRRLARQRPLAASLMDQALNQTAGEAAAAGTPAANRCVPSGR
jgi:hypothetical protein